MGFLSKFSGTKKLDFGDGFWVEVREYLTSTQKALIEQALIQPKMSVTGVGKNQAAMAMDAAMDIGASQLETAAQAVVSWNLTDVDDTPLPYSPIESLRESLGKLPGGVVDRIADATNVSGVDPDTFPEEGTPSA